MTDDDQFDPYPEPPAQRSAPILFALLGIVHLVVAVLFECLQLFNLVVGLLEILIAIWLAVAVARWRKKHHDWLARQKARISPQPPAGAG